MTMSQTPLRAAASRVGGEAALRLRIFLAWAESVAATSRDPVLRSSAGDIAAAVHATTHRSAALRHRVLRALRQLRVMTRPSTCRQEHAPESADLGVKAKPVGSVHTHSGAERQGRSSASKSTCSPVASRTDA